MPEEISLRDLAIFLTALGPDLPNYLKHPERISSHPRSQIWLESAEELGVIRRMEDRFEVRYEAIRRLIGWVRKVFDEWILSLY